MTVTAEATGTQTATVTTEHTLDDVAAAGTYTLHVDTDLMQTGDVLELRIYQIILTGGTRKIAYFQSYSGEQPTTDLIKISVPISNELTDAGSLRFTLKQTFGTSRDYPWKVLKYA